MTCGQSIQADGSRPVHDSAELARLKPETRFLLGVCREVGCIVSEVLPRSNRDLAVITARMTAVLPHRLDSRRKRADATAEFPE